MNRPAVVGKSAKEISKTLDLRLKNYALSAGAVGVSLMALAQPAAAEVIYTQVRDIVPLSFYAEDIDINGDGVPDVAFFHYTYGLSNSQNGVIEIDARKNAVVGVDIRYAEPLSDGAVIGASAHLKGGTLKMAHYQVLDVARRHYQSGPWNNVQNRYLGIAFKIGNDTHYGWIRVSVSDKTIGLKVLVTGYAYETEANTSIRAGQTSSNAASAAPQENSAGPIAPTATSLGMLAAGADGLALWHLE